MTKTVSSQDTRINELGLFKTTSELTSPPPKSVIEFGIRKETTGKKYKVPALCFSTSADWFQPDNIPLLNGRVLVNVRHYCEGTHLGIVQRASQLMTDYIAHRRFPGLEYLLFRDRADLFDRVQKRVLEHKKFLENKELALNDKFKSVSSQCEILIRDVKNGMI